jgi:hypothetical protein
LIINSHDNITTITTLHQQANNQLMACSHTPFRSTQEEDVCTVLQYAALQALTTTLQLTNVYQRFLQACT